MKIKFLFLIGCLFISSHLFAQSVDNRTVFFIGHSLVNLDMPAMFDGIAGSLNKNNAYDLQMGIGAPLQWNYNNPHTAQGSSAFDELPTGNYNTLVMTEAIPLVNHLTWSDTYVYATNFHDLGAAVNPTMQTYVYETWHCTGSGTPNGCEWDDHDDIPWRNRLDQDLPLWEGIADAIDDMSAYDAPPVLLVPAGQALGAVYDEIALGTLPGLTDISELFADNIHMNDLGNYFIALVQYATIYKASPVGAVANLSNEWGTPYDIPHQNTTLINRLQEIAWEVVSNYPRSGVNVPAPAPSLKSYIFGHSLVTHTQGDQSIPHWMYLLSQEAGQDYFVDGQFGFLPSHALPPTATWGFELAPSTWQGNFADSDYNNVIITAANFIQGEGPPTTPVIDGVNTIDATLRLFDHVRQEEADIPFYIYENWPEFNNWPPSPSEFQAYHNYTRGDFHDWWIDLQDLSNAARTNANIKLIPVGYILSGLLTDIPALASIPATELYEDGDPHGEAVMYFLTALIHYSALYAEQPPASFQVPNSLPSAVADNYSTIVDYIWDDLQAFNDSNGDSRVFFDDTVLSVEMINFEAVSKDCNIDLTWKINTNINHDYFEVERSLDSRHFEHISTLYEGDFYKNKDTYRFVDEAISKELYYYRLKQVAQDGTYDYSAVKTVQPDCLSVLPFAISPNPTQGLLNISMLDSFVVDTKIVISNLLGQAIKIVPFQTQLEVSELASGVYFIQLLSDYQKSQAQRLVVHR